MISPPSTEYWVELAQILGYQQIEFGYHEFPQIQSLNSSLLSSIGSLSIHAPYEWNEGFDLSTPRSDSSAPDEFVKATNLLAQQIPIASVVIHPPERRNRDNDELLQRIDQLTPLPRLENIFPPAGHNSLDDFAEFFQQVNSSTSREIGFTFDIPHAFISDGPDFLSLPTILQEKLMGEEGYLHVSDCSRTKDDHKPLGYGDIPWSQVYSFLQNLPFSGTIVLELPSPPLPKKPEFIANGIIESYSRLIPVYPPSEQEPIQTILQEKQRLVTTQIQKLRQLPVDLHEA